MSDQEARDIVINALTARHEELHEGEAMPRDHQGGDKVIRALEEAGYQIVRRPEPEQPNVPGALEVAEYGRYDGSHHKNWVIDQMVRYLTGCPLVPMVNNLAEPEPYHYLGLGESEAYRRFRENFPYWSEGVAP